MAIIKFIAEIEKAYEALKPTDMLDYPEISMISQGLKMIVNKIQNVGAVQKATN